MAACTDDFDTPFPWLTVLYFCQCAPELNALSSNISSEENVFSFSL